MNALSKSIFTVVFSCFILMYMAGAAHAQQRGNSKSRASPNASVSQTIGTTNISITYGRPSVKGREVYGGLVPYNKPWRAGANEATTIILPTDVKIEGKLLKAGTYSFYTIPGEDQWSVVISNNLAWGIPIDRSKDVLEVQVEAEEAPFREQLMIYFENVTDTSADVVVHWADLKIPFTIEV